MSYVNRLQTKSQVVIADGRRLQTSPKSSSPNSEDWYPQPVVLQERSPYANMIPDATPNTSRWLLLHIRGIPCAEAWNRHVLHMGNEKAKI